MISLGGYLGRAGSMVELPSANGPIDRPSARGETVHTLASGGTAVTRTPLSKRNWSLPFESLESGDADVINGFYDGMFGVGPFRFVDPTVRNVLPFAASVTGAATTQPLGWGMTVGAVTVAGSSPDAAPNADALQWSGASRPSGSYLQLGAPAVDVSTAPPWVPSEFCAASLWVKTISGSVAATFGLHGYYTDGTQLTAAYWTSQGISAAASAVTTPVTITTTWQRLVVVTSPGEAVLTTGAGAALLVPRLTLTASTSSTVQFSAAQVEYGDAPTAWQAGFGAPPVILTASPGRSVPQLGYSDHTLTLAEV